MMQEPLSSATMPSLDAALPREQKVVLVMDLVESVRMMEGDEQGVIGRWRRFVQQARDEVLPTCHGRLVKSLGDGLMIEFNDARHAVQCALQLHALMAPGNASLPPAQQMHMRGGAHVSHVYVDGMDIYGSGVNLAARVATLAGPGETVVTAAVRDVLTDGLDADLEDLGECYLKHVQTPVRVYRAGPAGIRPVLVPHHEYSAPLHPTIAVIPFEARSNADEHFAVGELIADAVIARLGRTEDLRVISRLSSTSFRGRQAHVGEIESQLGATYVFSGSYVASGGKLLISAELAHAHDGHVVWSERMNGDLADLLQAESELGHRLASGVHDAVLHSEVRKTLTRPLPTLESYSLLLGGITMMYRSSAREFDRSREALDLLIERHHRIGIPRAWLAKWYVMRVVRGMSDAPQKDAQLAIECSKRALDADPDSALALAIQGHALCQLSGDVQGSVEVIDEAIKTNPNEALAWLYRSVWSSMWGSSEAAVREAKKAAGLSPLDPMKYYYDMILASAYSINRDYENAIELATRSLRANRHHQPTLRVLLHAQVESGRIEDARQTLAHLMREVPNLSVSSYLSMGGAQSGPRQRLAAALRTLGVPES